MKYTGLNNREKTRFVILTVCIYAGMNFAHPVTPAYIRDLGISDSYFTIFFSSMALALMIFAPYFGSKGDVYGRKWFVALGIFGYGIGQIMFAYFNHPYLIVIARAFSGVFAAAIFTNLISFIAENTSLKERTTAMSIFTGISVFSSTLGYYIGGVLGELSPVRAIYFQGLFDIAIAFAVLIYFPLKRTEYKKRGNIFQNIKNLKKLNHALVFLLLATTFFVLAQNNTAKFLDVFLDENGFTTKQIGKYALIRGGINILGVFIIVPLLLKKFKELTIMRIALIISAISLIASFTFVRFEIAMYTTYFLYYTMISIYTPLDQAFLSKQITENYGIVLGVRESFRSIGLVVGPLLILGLQGAFPNNYTTKYVFYFSAIIFIVSFFLLTTFTRRYRK